MVDFNNEATVSTSAGDVVKIVMLERRYNLIDALEKYNLADALGVDNTRELAVLKARVFTLFLEIEPIVKRHIKTLDYDSSIPKAYLVKTIKTGVHSGVQEGYRGVQGVPLDPLFDRYFDALEQHNLKENKHLLMPGTTGIEELRLNYAKFKEREETFFSKMYPYKMYPSNSPDISSLSPSKMLLSTIKGALKSKKKFKDGYPVSLILKAGFSPDLIESLKSSGDIVEYRAGFLFPGEEKQEGEE